MTPEEEAEKQAQEAEAQALAQAEAEFASGFTGKPIETGPPSQEDEAAKVDEPKAEGDEAATDESTDENANAEVNTETPPEETDQAATVSKEQFEQLLAKANSIDDIRAAVDKLRGDVFGNLGGIQRVLKSLQDSTPAGESLEIKPEDLDEVGKEYPDLTKNLATGLTRVLKRLNLKGTGTSSLSTEEVDQRVNERANAIAQDVIARESVKLREEMATQILDLQHKGWRELVGPKDSNTEYRRWLKTKGEKYEKTMLSSDDPIAIGESISEFKRLQKAPAPQKPKTPVHARRQRLEDAVAPRGGAKPPLPKPKTPEEEFQEGFEYQTASR